MQVDECCAFAVVSHPGHKFLGIRARVGGELTEGLYGSVLNFAPVRSVYRWRGEILERIGGHASLHTRMSLVDTIVERVKASHPYEVPGISARPIVSGNPGYLQWIADETDSPH